MLLTCGMAVPFAIAVPAMFYLLLQGGLTSLNSLGLVSWGSMNSFVLTCVPLFMLMAEILRVSGLSKPHLWRPAKLVARLPGGLLADQYRRLRDVRFGRGLEHRHRGLDRRRGAAAAASRRNYDRPLAAGSLAAGGTLGILLPPSFGMIVYGTFTETSVPKLFMAGVVPGLIMTATVHALYRRPCHAGARRGAARAGPALAQRVVRRAFADVLPFAILIAGTLGGIYAGLVTTTEGADHRLQPRHPARRHRSAS